MSVFFFINDQGLMKVILNMSNNVFFPNLPKSMNWELDIKGPLRGYQKILLYILWFLRDFYNLVST